MPAACAALSPFTDNGVVAGAGGDGMLVAGLSFVQTFTAERDVVDPHWRSWLVSGQEEGWDVLLDLHGDVCVWLAWIALILWLLA
jgi:hypothetical protein